VWVRKGCKSIRGGARGSQGFILGLLAEEVIGRRERAMRILSRQVHRSTRSDCDR
jgi:hypothetical protein